MDGLEMKVNVYVLLDIYEKEIDAYALNEMIPSNIWNTIKENKNNITKLCIENNIPLCFVYSRMAYEGLISYNSKEYNEHKERI